jgi:hypothetical protein
MKMKKLSTILAVIAVLGLMSVPGWCDDNTINGCYKLKNGQLRIVEDTGECRPSELPISWIQSETEEVVPSGKLVEPGVYEVHTRVLWNLGMMTDESYLEGGYFTYNEHPKNLVYGPGSTLFLSPLKGYGIPEVQDGATRKLRLYVNYGHQWMCLGTPTVKISDVEFSLPNISGHYGAMAAGWSEYKDYSEYGHIGHSSIQVYLKDFEYGGDHCGPYPGTDRPKGTMYRVEAHFYDVFPE